MITYQDAVLLLTQLKDEGVDVGNRIKETLKQRNVSLETIKFINDNRPLDAYNFYEKIRKSYNDKKSKLYHNIVTEVTDPQEVLTTLASLQLQILLFNKKVVNSKMFLQHMRFLDIQQVMTVYYNDGNLIPMLKLLGLFKADLKVFEQFRKEQ